jgi:exonuclease III
LSKQVSKGLTEWCPVSARTIVARLETRFGNITITQSYAPTEQAHPEVKGKHYDDLSNTLAGVERQDIIILMGDMNYQVGNDKIGIEKIAGRQVPSIC